MRHLPVLVLLVGGCGGQAPTNPVVFQSNCTAAAPTAEAKRAAGRQSDGSVILPGGRRLTPAGTLLDVGGFPLALRLLPGDRYAVVTDGAYGTQSLRIVDLQAADPTHPVVSHQDYPYGETAHSPSLFYGLALSADGRRLYVSDGGYDPVPDSQPIAAHYNVVEVYDLTGDPPALARNDALTLQLKFSSVTGRYPAGIELSSDEKLLYVATQVDGSLAILDLRPGTGYGAEIGTANLPGIGPYDVAVADVNGSRLAFVSLWGGRRQGGNIVDGVALVDVTDPMAPLAMMDPIATGKAAEAELLVGGQLYVTNADSDTLSIIDTASRTVRSTPVGASVLLGASPNHLAIDPGDAMNPGRIYIADAGENAVVVLDRQSLGVIGRIPTAWYPTAVAVRGDGSLVIASAKGLGLGPVTSSPSPDGYMQGVLQLLPRPSDAALAAGDHTTADDLDRPHQSQVAVTCPNDGTPARFPLPIAAGQPAPIEHVFFILRENKTYDAVLGDLAGANGDPTLVMWDEEHTPNLHALARTFANFDNFYSQAEQSVQGHVWSTTSGTNDYTEKAWQTTAGWGRGTRPATAFAIGAETVLGLPGADTIWTHLDRTGVSYHTYGEEVNNISARVSTDYEYPGVYFALKIPDVTKIQYVIDRLLDPTVTIETFSYIGLPNDHTMGTVPGQPTPASMVADNDEATGRFIDALSHSPYWASSIVFIVEDDPSDGGDHVEAHRSICVAVSPWLKRGYVSSVNYDVPSIYRTIELLLGVGPMNLYDGHAAAMYDAFSPTPDVTPWSYVPRKIPQALNGKDAPLADESARIDFSQPDTAPLGRILWKSLHGPESEPPWRGAALPLRAAGAVDDDD
jgi:YVTN family beta-propeller protein